jgi:hypothetical protein
MTPFVQVLDQRTQCGLLASLVPGTSFPLLQGCELHKDVIFHHEVII